MAEDVWRKVRVWRTVVLAAAWCVVGGVVSVCNIYSTEVASLQSAVRGRLGLSESVQWTVQYTFYLRNCRDRSARTAHRGPVAGRTRWGHVGVGYVVCKYRLGTS
mgnify:CR=1 FL=1